MIGIKRFLICLAVFLMVILVGLTGSSINSSAENNKKDTFSTHGYYAKVDGSNLVVQTGNEIKIYDLHKKDLRKVISIPENKWLLGFDISGDYIVWADTRNESEEIARSDTKHGEYNVNSDIFAYNLKTGEQKQITDGISSQMQPKLWKNYMIYKDNREDETKEYPGKWSLFLYDMNTGKEQVLVPKLSAYSSYSIRDNKIVWEDDSNFKGPDYLKGGANVPENNKDICLFDMTTQKKTAIATGKFMESNPQVSGNYVVYEDRNNGSYHADIVLYNISTRKKIYITKDKFNQGDPCIYGDYVVWMDERNGISTNDVIVNGKMPNSDIFIYNIKTKKVKNLTGKEPQIMPSISSEWVTYITSRQINPIVVAIRYR